MLEIFLRCTAAVLVFQCILFIVALLKKNNGIADIGWGLGFIIIAAIGLHHYLFKCAYVSIFGKECEPDPAILLLVSLVLIWGLRLSIYLLIRNWSKAEDWRYAKWRQDWGKSFFVRSFFQVFILQGFFMLVIGSPIILSAFSSAVDSSSYIALQYLVLISGTIMWLIGFFFQAVGDSQLYNFKKDPANRGHVMRYGVWRYTRHPNYFGESAMWWGIFLISCVSVHRVEGFFLRIIGPATITFMLLRVSGVKMLESKYKGNIEYEEYQMNTSSFIPMPHKKK